MKNLAWWMGIVISFSTINNSYAAPEAGLALPGNVDAGRIILDNKQALEPKRSAPEMISPSKIVTAAPKGSDEVTFQLKGVIIEGATAYQKKDLEAIYAPYIGQKIALSQIYQFVGAITQRYHSDGYTLSRVLLPPQEINEGIIKIRVVEGYIDKIDVEGNYHKSSAVEAIIAKIKKYRPLKMSDLERAILILNDMAGVSVRAVLKSPEDKTFAAGATNLALIFTDLKVQSTVSLDNYGSRYVGPYQLSVQTAIDKILPYQHTTLNGLISLPMKEVQYIQASHRLLLNSYGTFGTVQMGYAHSEPGFRLKPNKIVSRSHNVGLYVSHPIIRSRAHSLYVGSDFSVNNSMTDALGSNLSEDRLRVLSIFANYDGSDAYLGSNIAQIRLSKGLDILGSTKTGSGNLSRANGHSDFTKITFNLGRLQSITETFRLYASATGQYTFNSLLSSEQFGYGGQRYGRAYDTSELTSDNGVAGMVELRYSGVQPFKTFNSEFFGFYDIGRVWATTNKDDRAASSAGIGMRFSNETYTGALTLAQPLTKKVGAPSYGSGYNPRIYFSFGTRF